jgi:hypothetical protein
MVTGLGIARGDDLADARTAFATMLEYQKTDDPRSPDLFTQDCAVTLFFTDGKSARMAKLPPQAFREMLAKQLKEKRGNKDVYEDVKYGQEGSSVRVTATILYHANGKRGPHSLLYVRDNGVMKIKEMNVTVFVDGAPAAPRDI